MQTDVGRGLEFSQRSMVVLPRSLLCTKRVQTLPSRSTCSLAWVFLAVPVSTRTTSRSTNPLSNARAFTCVCSGLGTRRRDCPEEARVRRARHRVRNPKKPLSLAFCARQGHVPGDDASVCVPQDGARTSSSAGGLQEHVTAVKSHFCDARTDTV